VDHQRKRSVGSLSPFFVGPVIFIEDQFERYAGFGPI
jgi:hypothetical protein